MNQMKSELLFLQKQRMDKLLAKMEPIVIRDAPSTKTNFKMQVQIIILCYMNLWGVAVLDCHPDHNKGPNYAPCTCQ